MRPAVNTHLLRTRSFFGPRAAGWDERFPDDEAVYRDAIAAVCPKRGGIVVDLGCGTGRALPLLRDAVGVGGVVIGLDATSEMLQVAIEKGRDGCAALVLADVTQLPLAPRRVDVVFAAGLLTHVPDPQELLRSLADASSAGARLAVFHPIGRDALARRHQRSLQPGELLDPKILPGVLAACGWTTERIDDAEDRYLAIASIK